jgi:hypothetical protein
MERRTFPASASATAGWPKLEAKAASPPEPRAFQARGSMFSRPGFLASGTKRDLLVLQVLEEVPQDIHDDVADGPKKGHDIAGGDRLRDGLGATDRIGEQQPDRRGGQCGRDRTNGRYQTHAPTDDAHRSPVYARYVTDACNARTHSVARCRLIQKDESEARMVGGVPPASHLQFNLAAGWARPELHHTLKPHRTEERQNQNAGVAAAIVRPSDSRGFWQTAASPTTTTVA